MGHWARHSFRAMGHVHHPQGLSPSILRLPGPLAVRRSARRMGTSVSMKTSLPMALLQLVTQRFGLGITLHLKTDQRLHRPPPTLLHHPLIQEPADTPLSRPDCSWDTPMLNRAAMKLSSTSQHFSSQPDPGPAFPARRSRHGDRRKTGHFPEFHADRMKMLGNWGLTGWILVTMIPL